MKLNFHTFTRDVALTVRNYIQVLDFTREHKLWRGIMSYRWLSKILMLVAVLASIKLLQIIISWFSTAASNGLSLSSVSGFFGTLISGGIELFTIGGLKYVILILMEVVIFHFTRRTLEILTGEDADDSFKDFVKAQIRMIGIAVYSFIMESIFSIVASIVLSIIMLGSIKPAVVILIQCYFLGFAIVDNYNEIYNMTLKQSARFTREYWGVALVTGIFVYIMMMAPLIGTVLGPLSGAVAATITMHQLTKGGKDIAWVFEEVV